MRFVILGLIAVVIFGTSLVVAKQDNSLCIPIGTIELKAPDSVEMELAPVDFHHSKHFSTNCMTCHHKWTGEGQIKNCTTSGCHDVATAPENPLKNGKYTDEAMKYYKYAYHEQCRPCHKDLKAANIEATSIDEVVQDIPTGCVECHPKESTSAH